MRIFLSAATENYLEKITPLKDIFETIIKLGHTQTNPYSSSMFKKRNNSRKTTRIDEKMKKSIRKSDLLLAEISVASFGVGYNICLARQYQLPIICLYYKKYKKNIPNFIKNLKKQQIKIIEYDEKNLKNKLKKVLKNTMPRKVRFNMNLDQDANNILSILAKERNKTKTEILHDLIRNEKKEKPNLII